MATKYNHTREHEALRAIYAQAKKYAKAGNGQGVRIARMAAEGLGIEMRKRKPAGKQMRLVLR